MNLPNINKRKVYLYSTAIIAGIVLLAGLAFTALFYTNRFFEQNTFKFQSPVQFQKPMWVEKRPVALSNPIFSHAEAAVETEYSDPLEQMIFDKFNAKFGKKVGHEAVAVSWAENGTRVCDRVNINKKDKSWDIGLFQINSIHLKRFKLERLVSCEQNVEVAIQIYSEQGWNPWVAYNNGNWKKYPQLAEKLKSI